MRERRGCEWSGTSRAFRGGIRGGSGGGMPDNMDVFLVLLIFYLRVGGVIILPGKEVVTVESPLPLRKTLIIRV